MENNDEENLNCDDIESDEEDDSDNENNLDNDMSDLKEDNESSADEEKEVKNTDKNKSKLFAQKLKEKKGIMEKARKQLPYTFTGNDFNSSINCSNIF